MFHRVRFSRLVGSTTMARVHCQFFICFEAMQWPKTFRHSQRSELKLVHRYTLPLAPGWMEQSVKSGLRRIYPSRDRRMWYHDLSRSHTRILPQYKQPKRDSSASGCCFSFSVTFPCSAESAYPAGRPIVCLWAGIPMGRQHR